MSAAEGSTPPQVDLDGVAAIYAAVLSDVCDALGKRHQALPQSFPIRTSSQTLVGWARTAHVVPVTEAPDRPYAREIDFIDSLGQGDVVVLACEGTDAAVWGELFSTAAVCRGARGAVIDGLIRDYARIKELGSEFPVHARGTRPTDCLGRTTLLEQDGVVRIGDVVVACGDLVVADDDGVTVVPRSIVLETVARATEKAATEGDARRLLREGALLADAWERFHVL